MQSFESVVFIFYEILGGVLVDPPPGYEVSKNPGPGRVKHLSQIMLVTYKKKLSRNYLLPFILVHAEGYSTYNIFTCFTKGRGGRGTLDHDSVTGEVLTGLSQKKFITFAMTSYLLNLNLRL